MPHFSVLIRTKNEARWARACLEAVFAQTVAADMEVLVLDSGSTDGTLDIVRAFQVRVDEIPASDYRAGAALNRLAAAAKGELLVTLSAHSVLRRPDALERAAAHFADPAVAGVYGSMVALPGAPLVEKLFYSWGYVAPFLPAVRETRTHMGIMGNTNAMLRRALWEAHPFDEILVGSEDKEWAGHWIARGKAVVFEPRYAVRHSHGLGPRAFMRQFRAWQRKAATAEARVQAGLGRD